MRFCLLSLFSLIPFVALADPGPWRIGAGSSTSWAGDPDIQIAYYEADCATGERAGELVVLEGPFNADQLREISDAAYIGIGRTVCITAYATRISDPSVRSVEVSVPQTFHLSPPLLQISP